MLEVQPLPAWILAGLAAPLLHADEEMEPAGDDMVIDDPILAAPLPPLPCPVHGWACPRLEQHDIHIEEAVPMEPEATLPSGSLHLPSPTPAQEIVGVGTPPSRAGLVPHLRAPVTSAGGVLDNRAGSSTAAALPLPAASDSSCRAPSWRPAVPAVGQGRRAR
jgi:hypothetical protein